MALAQQKPEVTIRLQALNGTWETCGVDRVRGIVPEAVVVSANIYGSDTCSFNLRRDPGAIFPDLTAFTPCDILIGGQKAWSGRVKQTPAQEGDLTTNISVQGEGWQYHLDDDCYQSTYIHTRISDYKDMRSFPTAVLSAAGGLAGGQVSNAPLGGALQIAFPNGTVVGSGAYVGVALDLGPLSAKAKRIVLQWNSSNNSAFTMFARGAPGPDTSTAGWAGATDAFTFANNSGASGTTAGNFGSTGFRYVQLFLYNSGAANTPAADVWIQIVAVQVFTDTTYETGNASNLMASTVVKDALNKATVLISSDQSAIASTTFAIPSLALPKLSTPRQVIDGVNAYHNWLTQVDVERRMVFTARPTAPLFELGKWSGAVFQDAAANSGQDIYSQVYVQATGPDGTPLAVLRTQGAQAGVVATSISSPSPDNPSATTNVTSWTGATNAPTRDTTTFHTSPASIAWTPAHSADVLTETFTGTFLGGTTYKLSFVFLNSNLFTTFIFGTATDSIQAVLLGGAGSSWVSATIAWTPRVAATGVTLKATNSAALNIDDLALTSVTPTTIEKRGFKRTAVLSVQSALTTAGANQIGDTFLSNHKASSYKGSIQVAGTDAIRAVQGGTPVHPSRLLTNMGQLVRLSHRVDPDTGGIGRDATMVAASYDHDSGSATVSLDNTRSNFDALLSRLAAING